ncbi:hypothetical protein U9M48_033833 [Paspalum notatum var. saurae]|uniref:Pentatricopeptide repeat-containing protein n=1 Tax=Paspalum notatum var. saurae TaxID=547442 RepID=A0AAQ3X757_PASNO
MGAAHCCFLSINTKNVEHWTSVIAGFAAHGQPDIALRLFVEMRQVGIEPNSVTIVAVLNACSHGGIIDEGLKCFGLMRSMAAWASSGQRSHTMAAWLISLGMLGS